MKTVLLRLSGFTVLPLLSLITPLLLLPVISSIVGPNGISSVLSGQAIGTFGATVLMWGWNVEGPVAIARAKSSGERGVIYLSSIRTRLLLLLPVLPIAVAVSALVAAPEFRFDAASMAVASLLAGMSPAWFCIGMGQPKLLAIFDTVPRFIATALSAPLLLLTHQLWHYTAVLAVATIVALVIFHRQLAPGGRWFPRPLRQVVGELRAQGHTAGINVAANAYASTPTPIATATTPAIVSGGLATADTLYRFGIFTIVALGNALQSWTIEPGVSGRRRRHLIAIWSHAVLGVAGAAFLTVFGPFASKLLFAGQIQATTELCFYYGVSFAFLSASTPFIRNILIPAGKKALVLKWTLVSAALGVSFMVVSGINGNIGGIAMGMALSEILLFGTLLIPALRLLKHEGNSHDNG